MGNLHSIFSFLIKDKTLPIYPTTENMEKLFSTLGFQVRDVNGLYGLFLRIDDDMSGYISVIEFLDFFELRRTRFSEKSFEVMDKDGNGEVDFTEFVMAMWNFCSFTKSSLARYSFSLYDLDGSGEIDLTESRRFIREVWGSEWEKNHAAHNILLKLESLAAENDGFSILQDQFVAFTDSHPILLFPAFQLQNEMRKKIMGENFWDHIASERLRVEKKLKSKDSIEDILHIFSENHIELLRTEHNGNLSTPALAPNANAVKYKLDNINQAKQHTAQSKANSHSDTKAHPNDSKVHAADEKTKATKGATESPANGNTIPQATKLTPQAALQRSNTIRAAGAKTNPTLTKTVNPALRRQMTTKSRQDNSTTKPAAAEPQLNKSHTQKQIKVTSPSKRSQEEPIAQVKLQQKIAPKDAKIHLE